MIDEIIDNLKQGINDLIFEINEQLQAQTNDFSVEESTLNKVNLFLDTYDKNGEYDFELLEEFINYFYLKNIIQEVINYKQLYEIRQELSKNFPERTKGIDDKFKTLVQTARQYTNSSLSNCKQIKAKIIDLNALKSDYNDMLIVLDKIIENKILSNEEMQILDKLPNIQDEDLLTIYMFVVKANYNIMKNNIIKNEETIAHESLSKKVKEKNSKKDALDTLPKQPDLAANIELSENTKALLEKASKIIENGNISDKEFIELVEDCTVSEALEYVYDFQNAGDNIALILNYMVIPKIKTGTLENPDQVLSLCISKYEEFLKKTDIDYILANSGRYYVKNEIEKVNRLLKLYEKNMDSKEYRPLMGFYYVLSKQLNDFKYIITDEELFNSSEFDLTFRQLMERASEFESAILPLMYDESEYIDYETEAQKEAKKLYKNGCNLIFFPDGVVLSDQIDNDELLVEQDKTKVLKGLEKLSNDDLIFTSSRHKVKDDDLKYSDLRSYRLSDCRVVYKTSRATSLEKILGRKVNVIFVLQVGYGAKDEKEKFYSMAKRKYDATYENINKITDILNSDDEDAIKNVLAQQFERMTQYIESCNINKDELSSHKIKGGSSNE